VGGAARWIRSIQRQETLVNGPVFDSQGIDRATFAPVVLINALHSEWQDVRLSFDAWDWLHELCGGDSLDGYDLNGYGVQGLVLACRLAAGLEPEADGIHYNSEGDTCFIHFASLDAAAETARLAAAVLQSRPAIAAMVAVARDHGFED
jgi:hypothetical protein